MIPGNQIIPVSSAGAFVPGRYAVYGDDCLFRGGIVIGDGSVGIDYQDWRARRHSCGQTLRTRLLWALAGALSRAIAAAEIEEGHRLRGT